MSQAVIGVYATHNEADEAVKALQKHGFDMKSISVVGKGYHSEEHAVGYYNTGERMKHWGKLGAFWGGVWGLLVGSAFFFIPGIGPVLAAGPLVSAIVGGLEGAVVVGGLSALGAGLVSIGVPKDSVVKYETQIKADKYLVVLHADPEDVPRAKQAVEGTGAEEVNVHA